MRYGRRQPRQQINYVPKVVQGDNPANQSQSDNRANQAPPGPQSGGQSNPAGPALQANPAGPRAGDAANPQPQADPLGPAQPVQPQGIPAPPEPPKIPAPPPIPIQRPPKPQPAAVFRQPPQVLGIHGPGAKNHYAVHKDTAAQLISYKNVTHPVTNVITQSRHADAEQTIEFCDPAIQNGPVLHTLTFDKSFSRKHLGLYSKKKVLKLNPSLGDELDFFFENQAGLMKKLNRVFGIRGQANICNCKHSKKKHEIKANTSTRCKGDGLTACHCSEFKNAYAVGRESKGKANTLGETHAPASTAIILNRISLQTFVSTLYRSLQSPPKQKYGAKMQFELEWNFGSKGSVITLETTGPVSLSGVKVKAFRDPPPPMDDTKPDPPGPYKWTVIHMDSDVP